MELRGQLFSCLFCTILLSVIPCSGQKYQGWTALLKNGFTTGHVSLDLKNVHPAERLQNGAVHSPNEWSTEVATKLQIAEASEESPEFKNGETLSEKGKKTVRFSLPETPEKSPEFKNGEILREKGKKRVRYSLQETLEKITETPEKSTEKMVKAILVLLVGMIVIGIIFFIYYCCRNRSRDPEKERLISAEEGRYGPGVDESQSQGKLQKEKGRIQTEKDEHQGEVGRIQTEKDELQREVDELQREVEWRRTHKYADDITLNPNTTHPNLSISEDRKNFTHEPQPQKVQPTPERFDSTVCVLGTEGFSSGKHYWEVEVVSSNDWDLGVARKSIQRKGKLSLSPKEGFWALGLSGRDYWAKTDPWTRVLVQKKPKKIGVYLSYLSYQEGQVTFFNVTDMSVLFTFNDCSFSGEVYPFFKNSQKDTSLSICSIKEDE